VAADIFRMVGYGFNEVNGLGFRIATFDILGSNLWVALETVLGTIELNDEYFPQVSGMKYSFDPGKEPGSRLLEVTIGDEPLFPDSTYSVTGNEFFAAILTDYLEVPISNLAVLDTGKISEFEVLLDYITAQQTLEPVVEGRIVATIAPDAVEDGKQIPEGYLLKQNYPNPFNPTTNFEFRIADFGLATLKIYDVLGNEVATIVNEQLPAGDYNFQWNANGFASGVYFYQLKAGRFVDTKKLILLR
jgi:hypothetical protein